MKFKPIDEMSLRHLFSTSYAENALSLSYIGPVLNSGGAIDSSPDCMILDMREHPFKSLRCEFKYIPSGPQDFINNDTFNIAIVWALPPKYSKHQLLDELLKQNGCSEVIVLSENKAFAELPTYTADFLSRLVEADMTILRHLILHYRKRHFASVFGLCIAARLYPDKFSLDRMIKLLTRKFPDVKRMQPKGRANIITAFMMSKPAFIERMFGDIYRWTAKVNSVIAAAEITQLIRENFEKESPSDEDLDAVRA